MPANPRIATDPEIQPTAVPRVIRQTTPPMVRPAHANARTNTQHRCVVRAIGASSHRSTAEACLSAVERTRSSCPPCARSATHGTVHLCPGRADLGGSRRAVPFAGDRSATATTARVRTRAVLQLPNARRPGLGSNDSEHVGPDIRFAAFLAPVIGFLSYLGFGRQRRRRR